MTVVDVEAPRTTWRIALLVASVVLLGITLAWAFLSMRVVMEVGGSCADGGPYVSAQPCPSGAGFIGLAIPLMLIAAFAGSFAGASLPAPNLLVPMWLFLFGSLGWNFLDSGFTSVGGAAGGWIVCGVVFELMALPALYFIWAELRPGVFPQRGTGDPSALLRWWSAYPVLGAIGAVIGIVTFRGMT